jgi:CHAT domain-containing protein
LEDYLKCLHTPDVYPVAEAARRLYRQLIEPLGLTPGAPLTIVPDGNLYLLPFGALLAKDPPAEAPLRAWPWLAAEREIHYAFSVQLLDFARRRRGRGNGRVLALAPVARLVPGGVLPGRLELPATLRTVRHLAALLPTDTLINAAANRRAFRDTADAYSLIHLGTHAYLDEGGSFLLHDPAPARYTMTDLTEHQLRADLVVMGACETGLGESLYGEGVASLGRGFARRGAPGIMMSLWSINDAATAELLNAVYDGLADGRGPSAALHGAGLGYRKAVTNPAFGHPYYWAGMVYYGPEAGLDFGGGWSWWWGVLLVGTLLLGYLGLRSR